MQKLICRWLK